MSCTMLPPPFCWMVWIRLPRPPVPPSCCRSPLATAGWSCVAPSVLPLCPPISPPASFDTESKMLPILPPLLLSTFLTEENIRSETVRRHEVSTNSSENILGMTQQFPLHQTDS